VPEYLAPGVYVEEVSFRSQAIEGVSTTTTAFIGPTRTGPLEGPLQLLTSLADFEAIYGDGQPLDFGGPPMSNFMWQATMQFFAQGGQRLYVQRVCNQTAANAENPVSPIQQAGAGAAAGGGSAVSLRMRAKWPGGAMDGTPVTIALTMGQNVLAPSTPPGGAPGSGPPTANGLADKDVVWIHTLSSPPTVGYHQAQLDTSSGQAVWSFSPLESTSPPAAPLMLSHLNASPNLASSDTVRVVTATVTVQPTTPGALPQVWSGLPLDPNHQSYGAPDSLFAVFSATATSPNSLSIPVAFEVESAASPPTPVSGLDVVAALGAPALHPQQPGPSTTVALTGGSDGTRPFASDYLSLTANPDDKRGLAGFEDIDEISIVAAPGSTFGYENGYRDEGATIMNYLIEHVEKMRYRVAVLDSGDGQSMAAVQAMRGIVDSEHAALYYPWVKVLDPITQTELMLPPCGFVAGIYARNDIERAVYKAPANEPVLGALGFEKVINKAQQEVLNPLGINCFRFFEDRGYRLWGARTISSNSQWKYVNVRRYFAYLEHSIDKGTQWVVFEPNGPKLWDNVRTTISDFLFAEFQAGALFGDKPSDAYFVRCDRTTMTQNDIDNGRLVCLIGVAPLYPAEFVIFRIGQWTTSSTRG
jgi:uncharacterized protein